MDIKELTQELANLHLTRKQFILGLLEKGMPQAEIAKQLGISRQRVNQIIKDSK
jgi:DNA-binding CsgD family transcriptional regulator